MKVNKPKTLDISVGSDVDFVGKYVGLRVVIVVSHVVDVFAVVVCGCGGNDCIQMFVIDAFILLFNISPINNECLSFDVDNNGL